MPNHVEKVDIRKTSPASTPTHRYVRPVGLAAVGGLVLALAVAATTPRAIAQEVAGRPCSEATLRGQYGFVVTGIRAAGATTEQFVAVGLRTYDGVGGFTDVASFHGQVLPIVRSRTAFGTYVVNADCTGTTTVHPPAPFPTIESDFVVVNNGKTVREAVMSPQPNVVTAVLERQ